MKNLYLISNLLLLLLFCSCSPGLMKRAEQAAVVFCILLPVLYKPCGPHMVLPRSAVVAKTITFTWSHLIPGAPCAQQLYLGGERSTTSSFPVTSLVLNFYSSFVALITLELPALRCF